jgi:hypothetical protein
MRSTWLGDESGVTPSDVAVSVIANGPVGLAPSTSPRMVFSLPSACRRRQDSTLATATLRGWRDARGRIVHRPGEHATTQARSARVSSTHRLASQPQ